MWRAVSIRLAKRNSKTDEKKIRKGNVFRNTKINRIRLDDVIIIGMELVELISIAFTFYKNRNTILTI